MIHTGLPPVTLNSLRPFWIHLWEEVFTYLCDVHMRMSQIPVNRGPDLNAEPEARDADWQ